METFVILAVIFLIINIISNKKLSKSYLNLKDIVILTAGMSAFFYSYKILTENIPHSNVEENLAFAAFAVSVITGLMYLIYKFKNYGTLAWFSLFDFYLAYFISEFLYEHFSFVKVGIIAFLFLIYLYYSFVMIDFIRSIYRLSENSFFLSMVVTSLTGSVILGYLIGGSFFGAVFGDFLSDDSDDERECSVQNEGYAGSDSCDNESNNHDSYENYSYEDENTLKLFENDDNDDSFWSDEESGWSGWDDDYE